VTALSVRGLVDRGWECTVVAPSYPAGAGGFADPETPERVVSIPSMPMPVYPDLRLSVPDYRTVKTTVDVFQPDVVHCATEFVIGGLGQLAAKAAGIPVVSSYHTDFGRYTAAYGVPWLAGGVNRYVSGFHRRNQLTLTPSAAARGDLLRMGVPRVEVWGCGVDTRLFAPTKRDDALRSRHAPDGAFLFLHVGRLAAEKNIHVLVDAFRIASEQLPAGSIRLVIAGAGPEEERLRAAAVPGLSFLGVLDRRKVLPGLYASADAFLFASLTETLGLVVLEAMASAVPVIATPAGGVGDHLRNLENGLSVPENAPAAMARAMVQLVHDNNLRQRLAAGARSTAVRLGWDAELDRLDSLYRDIIGIGTSTERVA